MLQLDHIATPKFVQVWPSFPYSQPKYSSAESNCPFISQMKCPIMSGLCSKNNPNAAHTVTHCGIIKIMRYVVLKSCTTTKQSSFFESTDDEWVIVCTSCVFAFTSLVVALKVGMHDNGFFANIQYADILQLIWPINNKPIYMYSFFPHLIAEIKSLL